MITIIYSGTTTEERLDNDRENLESEIIEGIKEAINNSAFWIDAFQAVESKHLDNDKILFSVPIQLIKKSETAEHRSDDEHK